MAIFHGSRYEFEPLDRISRADGDQNLTVFTRSLSARYNRAPWRFSQYIVVEGDRLETLAYRAYGQPSLWWLIADANPEIFHPEDDLVSGSVLRIPEYRPLRRLLLPASSTVNGITFQAGAFNGATLR